MLGHHKHFLLTYNKILKLKNKKSFTKKYTYDKRQLIKYNYILFSIQYLKRVKKMKKFTKMHGLGNDYVYMDAIHQK